ncbi:MAG: outer membrane lipid asymmetry maintenance protein MlaD [Rickettsiaceae bacterium H1]|nr:outer membrane lipid asymmetry maintenance protein MlaD [Rickettsiaceae bacterium H1]
MNKNVFEAAIGGVILLFVIVLIYFASLQINKNDEKYYKITAYFDDITGLFLGSDVTIAGIKVGEVTKTIFDQEKKAAKVEISVRESIKIPEDSSAQIISGGLIRDKLIKIELGTSNNSISPEGEIEYTQSSINIESLINKFIFSS